MCSEIRGYVVEIVPMEKESQFAVWCRDLERTI